MEGNIELTFIRQRTVSFEDINKPVDNGVYYKKGDDWVYTKIESNGIAFNITEKQIKDIETIISQFKALNPRYSLSNVRYKTI